MVVNFIFVQSSNPFRSIIEVWNNIVLNVRYEVGVKFSHQKFGTKSVISHNNNKFIYEYMWE